MKVVHIFIISFVLFSCSSVLIETNDLDKLDLKGKIKSIDIKAISDKDTIQKVLIFNKTGNTLIEKDFSIDGGSIDKPATKTIYTYTKFGEKKVKKQYELSGELYRKENYKYNSKKKLIEKNKSDGKGNQLLTLNYKYNNKGQMVEEIVKDVSYGSNTVDKGTFKYDSRGNLIERKYYNNNGVLQSVFSNKYSNNHLIASESIFFTKKRVIKNINSYDNNGNVIEIKSYDENNQLILTVITVFDIKSNRIESLDFRNNLKKRTTYKYQYDLHDNWIYNEVYINNKLKGIIQREIEYYIK